MTNDKNFDCSCKIKQGGELQIKCKEVISDCKNYRYRFSCIWDDTKPKVLFILLNPATDKEHDNPQKAHRTRTRCMDFAKSWGYGGFMVGNLFAYRAQYPKELVEIQKKGIDPIGGKENYEHLLEMSEKCEKIVCAWGHIKIVHKLKGDDCIRHLFHQKQLYCIELSNGTPKHPLFLKKELKPIPFTN